MRDSPSRSPRFETQWRLSSRVALCLAAGLVPGLFAADAAKFPSSSLSNLREMGPGRNVKTGDFVFSILPKSLQKTPTLDMTFNTEMTDYGRLLRAASPENPVYYVELDAGFRQLGWFMGGEKPPKAAELERTLNTALTTNGYQPATPDHPAGLALIYYWGSHNKPDPDAARDFPDMMRRNVLERAILVGGKKFAAGMSFAMEWGESPGDHEQKLEFLRDQTYEELYYVVASAYDYQALAHGQRKLAWRTTMTVTSAGLAMNETLPAVVSMAAPFFGRETEVPEIGSRRISREGHVFVGTPTVVDDKPKKDAVKP